jgi:hypothetical protein
MSKIPYFATQINTPVRDTGESYWAECAATKQGGAQTNMAHQTTSLPADNPQGNIYITPPLVVGGEYNLTNVLPPAMCFEKTTFVAGWQSEGQFYFLSRWDESREKWESVFVVVGRLLMRAKKTDQSFELTPSGYTLDNLRAVDDDLDLSIWADAIALADSLPDAPGKGD